MAVEKRIYAIVASTVDSKVYQRIEQPLGRQFAQGIHAARKMQSELDWRDRLGTSKNAIKFIPITTITLSVRNTKELYLIQRLLRDAGVEHTYFHDKNRDAYGEPGPVLTALCTYPVPEKSVVGILDHLPLVDANNLHA